MPGLTAAAFLALATACAPDVAPQTLLAIAQVESDLSPWAIHDNTAKQGYAPADQVAAIDFAIRLRAAGHSIDTGIMQINSANWGWLGLSLEDAFDPCRNIRAGATELTSYSRYNTGKPQAGFTNGYVRRVVDSRESFRKGSDSMASPAFPGPPGVPTPQNTATEVNPFLAPSTAVAELVFNIRR